MESRFEVWRWTRRAAACLSKKVPTTSGIALPDQPQLKVAAGRSMTSASSPPRQAAQLRIDSTNVRLFSSPLLHPAVCTRNLASQRLEHNHERGPSPIAPPLILITTPSATPPATRNRSKASGDLRHRSVNAREGSLGRVALISDQRGASGAEIRPPIDRRYWTLGDDDGPTLFYTCSIKTSRTIGFMVPRITVSYQFVSINSISSWRDACLETPT